jgi:AraC family transcriptional regulator of adaptative response / DNA-3-methyladenine glycosylase II
LAPGNASVDARGRLARSAVQLIEEGVFQAGGLAEIAEQLDVTPRHLRRTFQSELGVSPVEFAQTQRLLLAKQLLTDTRMPVTEVAFSAGFGSLRRLNALFHERYRLSPRQLRKNPKRDVREDALRFELSFRPPYDWAGFVHFLEMRCIRCVDEVDGARYRRIVRLTRDGKTHSGWIEIGLNDGKASLEVFVSNSLKKVLPAVLARVKNLTDVCCNPAEINERLGILSAANPGLRVPGTFDGFEIAVRAILGQQVSVKAARTLLGRFVERFGANQLCGVGGLTNAFPLAEEIATLPYAEVAELGMPETRAVSVVEMAKAVANGFVSLSPGVDVEDATEKMRSLPGIGDWTAQYIAMRALGWPDAFPHTDLGVMRAMGERNPRRVLAAAECWRPWRAYAVLHLWNGGNCNGSVSRSA